MNILFLMADQLRDDCVGYAQDSKVATPNIDRIAEGTSFTRCQTVNPICMPARCALLTGKYTRQIGALSMSGDIDLRHPTFTQALQRAGYWTAGVGKFHYLQSWPWDRERGKGVNLVALKDTIKSLGYDYVWESAGKQLALKNYCDYCQYLEDRGLLEPYRDMIENRGANCGTVSSELKHDGDAWPFQEEHHIDIVTGREICKAINTRPKDKPFFIFGSFCSPHKPFDPPQRFLDQVPYEEVDDFVPGESSLAQQEKQTLWKLRRAYKATVKLVDEEIGKILNLLEEQELLENTLVLFTADHGEMMGDHRRVQKSLYYRESQQVPLAIRHPAHLTGQRNESMVELTDISATILDAAGLDPQTELSLPFPVHNNVVPCRSLLPIIKGEVDSIRDFAYSECQNAWSCITSEHYKYVRLHYSNDPDAPEELFFHTQSDPSESLSLLGDPSHNDSLLWHRRRLDFIRDKMPPAQHAWAPLMD